MWNGTRLTGYFPNLMIGDRRRTRRHSISLDPVVAIERLEQRIVLSAVTGEEQYFLELVNRARQDPVAEAARLGVNLNEGLSAGTLAPGPRQPLALNDNLQAAIEGHLLDEDTHDFFSHTGSNGSSFITRINAAGYTNWSLIVEDVGLQYGGHSFNVTQFVSDVYKSLFLDVGAAGRGDRVNLLNGVYKEVGSGVQVGTYQGQSAVFTGDDFGVRDGNSFLTGVIYSDTVAANNLYDVGEGMGGISVVVSGAGNTTYSTTANAAGGYQIALPAGSYTVTFSGAGISLPIVKSFTIDSQNVEVDANTRIDKGTGGPPALSGTSPIDYIENTTAKPIDASISVTDLGRTTLSTATITISSFAAGQDVLGFVPNATTMGNIAITSNASGVLKLSSAGVTATSAQWQAALRSVTYLNTSNKPSTTARSVTFVIDDGKTLNHQSNTLTTTIAVTAVNDAPVGTAKTLTTLEDTAYVFKTTDFGLTDPNDSPANSLLAVKIATLPLVGHLTDNGLAVAANAHISAADITAGKLKFTPLANKYGTAYASFTFQVQDNGGTANGGVDTDTVARTATFSVTSVNDAPVGVSKTVTTLEDTAYVLKVGDFALTDPLDVPANTLKAVKITMLPLVGTLSDSGVPLAVGASVPVADLIAGKFIFMPVANKNGAIYARLNFQVQDNGGTANSGIDTDPVVRVITFAVTSVNDAPIGTAKTVAGLKNTDYAFKVVDFGFTDPSDIPPNTFLAVKIATLPVLGKLTDNGVDVTAGTRVSIADITTGKLKFTPATNGVGATYASFTFQVQDNGGTVSGGIDVDLTPKKMTISVT